MVAQIAGRLVPGAESCPRVCARCDLIFLAPLDRCPLDGEALADEVGDALIGKTIDRYLLVEYLGAGRTARVYRARHTLRDHECAVKVFFGDVVRHQDALEKFKAEMESLLRLRHPNLVAVENYGAIPGRAMFVANELVQAGTLAQLLQRERDVTVPEAARIARDIARGLGAAHRMGFVHRALTPGNIFLRRLEDSARVGDFGLSSSLMVPSLGGEVFTEKAPIGDARYVAPEQTQRGPVGPTADLYALGIILYEMLTRELPFTGATPAEILAKKNSEYPRELPPSNALAPLVSWLMQRVEEDRPSSAEAVMDEVNRILSNIEKPRSTSGLIAELHYPSNPSISGIDAMAPTPDPMPAATPPQEFPLSDTLPRTPSAPRIRRARTIYPSPTTPTSAPTPATMDGRPPVTPGSVVRVFVIALIVVAAYFLGAMRGSCAEATSTTKSALSEPSR